MPPTAVTVRTVLHRHAALLDDRLPDLLAQPLLERLRRVLATALARQQHLQVLLDAELLEARAALVQVLLATARDASVALVVEEQPHLGQHLRAVGLM